MKKFLSQSGINKNNLADHLCEFLRRLNCKKHELNLFKKLVSNIKKVYYTEKIKK